MIDWVKSIQNIRGVLIARMDKSADWIEEYLAKLRAKVIDTIVEITNQTDPVKEIQLQF